MTSFVQTDGGVLYVQRVAQIICNGLYPEARAVGKTLADFPVSTRENLLTIAEAILVETGVGGAAGRAGESPAYDVEAMLCGCVPGGVHCDPQAIADAIREWCRERKRPKAGAGAMPSTHREVRA